MFITKCGHLFKQTTAPFIFVNLKNRFTCLLFQLQTPQSFSQSVSELVIALQRTGDPCNLQRLRPHLEFLANVDPSPGKAIFNPSVWNRSKFSISVLLFSFFSSTKMCPMMYQENLHVCEQKILFNIFFNFKGSFTKGLLCVWQYLSQGLALH